MARAFVALVLLVSACHPLPPGSVARSFRFGGLERSYLLHDGGSGPKAGLILALHGLRGSGAAIERRMRLDAAAERAAMVVAYPDGQGAKWRAWPGGDLDDVGFLAALAGSLAKEYGLGPGRVFAAGLSNGASMVGRLLCEGGVLAAGALVSGAVPPPIVERCTAGPPVPVLQVQGTADHVVPYEWAVPASRAIWLARDGCSQPPETTALPDADPTDGTRVKRERWSCRGGSEYVLYTVEGGGHQWPGGEPSGIRGRGPTSRDLDASAAIVDFFARHAR